MTGLSFLPGPQRLRDPEDWCAIPSKMDATVSRITYLRFVDLSPQIYEELKQIASRLLAGERKGHTLQSTALLHEALMVLSKQRNINPGDKIAFLGAAGRTMRRVLVDYARERNAIKRGKGIRPSDVNAVDVGDSSSSDQYDMIELADLIEKLKEQLGERPAEVAELRVFGGLTVNEIAEVLAVSPTTVNNDWKSAKQWLADRLNP